MVIIGDDEMTWAIKQPTQVCRVCNDYEIVKPDGRGFPPDIAARKLAKRCKLNGHKCDPQYSAGVSISVSRYRN